MNVLDRFTQDPLGAVIFLLGVVLAFTVHELGHAWVAVQEGDDTPLNEGRLTLNPLRHIDPLGLILIVLVGFGWARPVVTRPGRYRHGRLGEVLVSLAGVAANALLALVALLAMRFLGLRWEDGQLANTGDASRTVLIGLLDFFSLNVMLLVFNLLPLPPLDGSHVLAALVPGQLGRSLRFHVNRSWYLALVVVVLFPDQLRSLWEAVSSWALAAVL